MDYYWKVTPKVNLFYFLLGLLGVGILLSSFKVTDNIGIGYVASGILLFFCYKWEKIETYIK